MSKDYTFDRSALCLAADPSTWPKGTPVRRKTPLKLSYYRTGVVYGVDGSQLRVEWTADEHFSCRVIARCSPNELVPLSPEEIVLNEDF